LPRTRPEENGHGPAGDKEMSPVRKKRRTAKVKTLKPLAEVG
jgi:hypothetical protein